MRCATRCQLWLIMRPSARPRESQDHDTTLAHRDSATITTTSQPNSSIHHQASTTIAPPRAIYIGHRGSSRPTSDDGRSLQPRRCLHGTPQLQVLSVARPHFRRRSAPCTRHERILRGPPARPNASRTTPAPVHWLIAGHGAPLLPSIGHFSSSMSGAVPR